MLLQELVGGSRGSPCIGDSGASSPPMLLLLLLPLPPLVCQGHVGILENQLEKVFV